MIKSLSIILLIFVGWQISAQENSLQVKYTTSSIKLDGVLDDEVWATANEATNFWQHFPVDSLHTTRNTSVKIVYNDQAILIGIKASGSDDSPTVTSLKRDFLGNANDNVTLVFDTYSDGANAFSFGVTPYGVQREVAVSLGGARDGFNLNWDVKWSNESKIYDDHFTMEVIIPFSSIKFKEGSNKWRFQTYRWDLKNNEQSAWVKVPQNQLLSSLAFMGELIFEKPLGKSKAPIYAIPYINTLTEKDYTTNKGNQKLKIGGDAKVAVGNGLNLDLTANPDFSNVEVDDIVTNLTRFELRLPEKRQFFIDNNDLFDNFGNYFQEARPFFSRRIGLLRDTVGNLVPNQILGGVRLSGKLNKDWRIGLLNIQTADDQKNKVGSYNNMMMAVQRKFGSRSNLGVFMVNRQTFDKDKFIKPADIFNRVVGVDYNLLSKNNALTGRFYLHKSFQNDDVNGNFSSQAMLIYNSRKYSVVTDFVYVDKDFRADLGFVPRRDVFKTGHVITRVFYPKSKIINTHSFRLLSLMFWRPTQDFKNTDQLNTAAWIVAFKKSSTFEVDFVNNFIFLTSPFDPTNTKGSKPLPGNVGYRFNNITTSFASNNAKLFTYSFMANVGKFYTGNRYSIGGTIGYRIQPKAQFSLSYNYDGIKLPSPHASANILLLSPRVEFTFSKSLFWSTLIQYSNRRDNLGVNSRLQWRFAPLSDLYLVYNDSYIVSDFGPRYRSLNLKMTYWLRA
jgi:hypothetical protein